MGPVSLLTRILRGMERALGSAPLTRHQSFDCGNRKPMPGNEIRRMFSYSEDPDIARSIQLMPSRFI